MDFFEDLFDFDSRKRKKNSQASDEADHHHHEDEHSHHHDDHDRHDRHDAGHILRENGNYNHSPQAQAVPTIHTNAICARCTKPITPDARFCHHCGAAVDGNIECKSCGYSVPANAKFCPACGNTLATR